MSLDHQIFATPMPVQAHIFGNQLKLNGKYLLRDYEVSDKLLPSVERNCGPACLTPKIASKWVV